MTPARATLRVLVRSQGANAVNDSTYLSPYAPDRNEHAGQAALFQWAALQGARFPQLERLLYAVPNGGQRDARTAGMLKAEGTKAGTSDVFLSVPRGRYGALIIENKAAGGRLRPDQYAFLEAAALAGNFCAVSTGWECARDLIKLYLSSEEYHGLSFYGALGWPVPERPA